MFLGTIDRSSARNFGCIGCEIPVPLGCGLSAKFEARGRFPCQEIRKWSMRIRPPSTPATNACGKFAAAACGKPSLRYSLRTMQDDLPSETESNHRRKLVVALGATMLAAPLPAVAQAPGRVWRVGFLSARAESGPNEEVFRQALRELGHVEGKNIVIEWRFSAGLSARYREMALDLVRQKVDCIVSFGIDTSLAVKLATPTIPIVMVSVSDDPVRRGLVASLARPGGNVTGFVVLGPDLSGKRLQMLREAVPRISRVAILWDRGSTANVSHVKETEVAARVLGIELQSLDVGAADGLENAFQAAAKGRAQALLVVATGFVNAHQARIADLAVKARLPAMYSNSQFPERGGLMSYAADNVEQFRGAATYVDRILKGAKPADLPVQQPTRFELIVNLDAARKIGLTVPAGVLLQANRVIE